MRVINLCSGSRANCTLIASETSAVLIDVGGTAKYITEKLSALGFPPERIGAIFITHEHSDHIAALPVLLKKSTMKVYVPSRCLPFIITDNMSRKEDISGIDDKSTVIVGDIEISSFRVHHDSTDCFGYIVNCDGHNCGIMTDVGVVTEDILDHLLVCDCGIFESNHDIEMVKNGKYAPQLKQRILSKHGHLSNDDCGMLLSFLAKKGSLKSAMLAHLSQENNSPVTAVHTVKKYLTESKANVSLSTAATLSETELTIC